MTAMTGTAAPIDAASATAPGRGAMRAIDWIWHIRGSLPLAPGQTSEEAFDRLEPLFQRRGTTHQRSGDTLTFQKVDQEAQDKMSVFDTGTLRVMRGAAGPTLQYRLNSRILLLCFLAPLLFLGFAQLTIFINTLDKPAAKTAHKPEKKKVEVPMNPIDKALGAPAPPKPDAKKKKEGDRKPTPTAAYVFAIMFAVLYVVGRVLEDLMVRSLFRRHLKA